MRNNIQYALWLPNETGTSYNPSKFGLYDWNVSRIPWNDKSGWEAFFKGRGANLYSLTGQSSKNYLELNLGDGLSVVDGKLTASSTAPTNMVTTDTAQNITGTKTFKGPIKVTNSGYTRTLADVNTNGRIPYLYLGESTSRMYLQASDPISRMSGGGIEYPIIDTGNLGSYVDGTTITYTNNKLTATSGGSTPTNMVTTDTAQTITGLKTFGGTDLSKMLLEGSESLISFRQNTDSLPTTLIGGFFDSNGKKSITIGSTDHETLSLNAKSVQDGSGNEFLTSGNVVAYVTEEFVDGTEGYRIWSNGRCEQWGRYSLDSSTGEQHLTFLKEYKDTNYLALVAKTSTDASTWNVMFGPITTDWSTSGLLIKANLTGYALRGPWYVSGILAS